MKQTQQDLSRAARGNRPNDRPATWQGAKVPRPAPKRGQIERDEDAEEKEDDDDDEDPAEPRDLLLGWW